MQFEQDTFADGSVRGTISEDGMSLEYRVPAGAIAQSYEAGVDLVASVRSLMEDQLAAELAVEKARNITIYSKPNCPHCTAAKHYLTENDIKFFEVNVAEDAEALRFLKERGHRTVPQLYVGKKLLVEGGNGGLQALTPDQVRERVQRKASLS